MTLRDWEEKLGGIGSAPLYKTINMHLPLLTVFVTTNLFTTNFNVTTYYFILLSGTETKFSSLFHDLMCPIFWSTLYMISITAEYQFSSPSQSEFMYRVYVYILEFMYSRQIVSETDWSSENNRRTVRN